MRSTSSCGPGGGYQRRNFAAAQTAAAAFLGREPSREHVEAVGAALVVHGRFEVLEGRPVTLLDGAHNDGGIEALADSLPDFVAGRRLVAVVSILDDKDAAGMLSRLLVHCDAVVCTAATSPRALPPATLASLAGQIGGAAASVVIGPHRALARARELAGADGVVLATGSIYLIGDLMRAEGTGGGFGAVNDDGGPSLLLMMAGVAVVVALVILVFVGIGYLFGRLVL